MLKYTISKISIKYLLFQQLQNVYVETLIRYSRKNFGDHKEYFKLQKWREDSKREKERDTHTHTQRERATLTWVF